MDFSGCSPGRLQGPTVSLPALLGSSQSSPMCEWPTALHSVTTLR